MSEGAENKQCCETSQWLWRRGWRAHVPERYLTHAAPGEREGGAQGVEILRGDCFTKACADRHSAALGGRGCRSLPPNFSFLARAVVMQAAVAAHYAVNAYLSTRVRGKQTPTTIGLQ